MAMAHGYFKAEGKPMAVLCHGTVGLQHAAMAIYNAYCDRVPVYILAGNTLDATLRRPGRGMGAQRAGRRGDGARLHQVGRPAGLAAALRRVGGARLQDRDDAADDAGAARHRRRAAGGSRSRTKSHRGCGFRSSRCRRRRRATPARCRSRAPARQRGEPGDRRRSRWRARRPGSRASSSWPRRCRRRSSIRAGA